MLELRPCILTADLLVYPMQCWEAWSPALRVLQALLPTPSFLPFLLCHIPGSIVEDFCLSEYDMTIALLDSRCGYHRKPAQDQSCCEGGEKDIFFSGIATCKLLVIL